MSNGERGTGNWELARAAFQIPIPRSYFTLPPSRFESVVPPQAKEVGSKASEVKIHARMSAS